MGERAYSTDMPFRKNFYFAASFDPMTAKEEKEFTCLVAPFAKTLMYYKP